MMQTMDRDQLDVLLEALRRRGFTLVGPTVRDGAIVYDELNSAAELPIGWTDEQEGGTYRLKRCDDAALFGYAVGPHSWKKYFLPPVMRLWKAGRVEPKASNTIAPKASNMVEPKASNKDETGFEITPESQEAPRLALIGVRSCELHAIAIQDKVFVQGPYVDPYYRSQRDNVFVIAIHCGQAGGTCFCVSMNTGPKATFGFDLALTELLEGDRHYFVVEVGTERGGEILRDVPHREAAAAEKAAAEQVVANTARRMGRTLDTTGIKELLYNNLEHPRWDDVAARCLACGNCTMACPTCFCTTVEDVTDLTGRDTERVRRWDSCFTLDFSYIRGGSVRSSHQSRYRQWLTHKLATWIDQFGTSGCVGCGRCITWCPVAIDITEEVRAIRGDTGDIGEGTP